MATGTTAGAGIDGRHAANSADADADAEVEAGWSIVAMVPGRTLQGHRQRDLGSATAHHVGATAPVPDAAGPAGAETGTSDGCHGRVPATASGEGDRTGAVTAATAPAAATSGDGGSASTSGCDDDDPGRADSHGDDSSWEGTNRAQRRRRRRVPAHNNSGSRRASEAGGRPSSRGRRRRSGHGWATVAAAAASDDDDSGDGDDVGGGSPSYGDDGTSWQTRGKSAGRRGGAGVPKMHWSQEVSLDRRRHASLALAVVAAVTGDHAAVGRRHGAARRVHPMPHQPRRLQYHLVHLVALAAL